MKEEEKKKKEEEEKREKKKRRRRRRRRRSRAVVQLVNKFHCYVKNDGSLPHAQQPKLFPVIS